MTGQNNRIFHFFEFEDTVMHGLMTWQHFHEETALIFQAAIFWTMIRSTSSRGWNVAPGSERPLPSRQQAAFRLCPGMFQEHHLRLPLPQSLMPGIRHARKNVPYWLTNFCAFKNSFDRVAAFECHQVTLTLHVSPSESETLIHYQQMSRTAQILNGNNWVITIIVIVMDIVIERIQQRNIIND